MKKRILITLLSAVLAANMTACNYMPEQRTEQITEQRIEQITGNAEITEAATTNSQKNMGADYPADHQSKKAYSTQELIETFEISDKLASVLKEETQVYSKIMDEFVYLSDMAWYMDSKWKYADVYVADMDGNGNKEMLLQYMDKIILLREYEGTVYAYEMGFRALYYLRTDGSYSWNRQHAGTDYGSSKVHFQGTEFRPIGLYMVENDGSENAKFYINEIQVTYEEIQLYVQNESPAELVASYLWKTDFKTPAINGK